MSNEGPTSTAILDAFASSAGDAALAAFEPAAAQAERDAHAAATKELRTELDLQLVEPITVGKDTITHLHLTEPTMKQLRESQRAAVPLGGMCVLLQLNTGLLPAVIDKLKQRDINAIDDFFAQFSRS